MSHVPKPEECNPGDIVLALFPPLRMSCEDTLQLPSYLRYLALRNHFKHINEDENLIFKRSNITLGHVIIETCSSVSRAAYFASRIRPSWTFFVDISESCRVVDPVIHENMYYVVGGVGDASSRPTEIISYIFQSNDIYMISSRASSDILADETQHPNLLRMVPPDSFQSGVIVDILTYFNWSYVIVLYDDSVYGRNLFKSFQTAIQTSDFIICIAVDSPLSGINLQFEDKLIAKIRSVPTAKVIVHFGKWKTFILERLKDKGYIFVGSVVSDAMPSEYTRYFIGSLFITYKFTDISGIKEIFNNLTYETIVAGSDYDKKFWESSHNCCFDPQPETCTNCSKYTKAPFRLTNQLNTQFDKTLDAITLYALAIDKLFKDGNCSLPIEDAVLCITSQKLGPVLKNSDVSGLDGQIKFNDDGNVLASYQLMQHKDDKTIIPIGHWNENEGLTVETTLLVILPKSVCSDPCQTGHARVDLTVCCWSCRECRDNEYVSNTTSCKVCPQFTWPDGETGEYCRVIDVDYLDYGSVQYIVIAVISAFGLVVTFVTLVFYFIYRTNQLLKASSLLLSSSCLLGIELSFITLLLFGGRPSIELCFTRNFLYHLSLTIPYSSLLVKTFRIYRVFAASSKGYRHPSFVGNKTIIGLTSILCTMQLVFLISLSIAHPLEPKTRMPDIYTAQVETFCPSSNSPTFWVPFGFNLAVILACTCLAFASRSLPDNFHDAKCIFASAASCGLTWFAFIPSLITSNSAKSQDFLIGLALCMSSFVVLGTVFLPKVYGVIAAREMNVQFYNQSNEMSVAPQPNPPTTRPIPIPS